MAKFIARPVSKRLLTRTEDQKREILSVIRIRTSIGRGKHVQVLWDGDFLHDGPDLAVGHSDKD